MVFFNAKGSNNYINRFTNGNALFSEGAKVVGTLNRKVRVDQVKYRERMF